MENDIYKNSLSQAFRSCCEHYFVDKFKDHRFLYFFLLPGNYFGTDFKIEIEQPIFDWLNDMGMKEEIHSLMDANYNERKYVFIQTCSITYKLKLNSIIIPETQHRNVKFYAYSFKPYGRSIFTNILDKNIEKLDSLRKSKQTIKKQWKVENIDEKRYRQDEIGFGFYTSVVRKQRHSTPHISEIAHGYVYYEIANCHAEIEECLLSALFFNQYISNLMGRKIDVDGAPLFLPNLSYVDFQYLMWVGFGFERIYTFWDRITFLLANFNLEGSNIKTVSFDKYFEKIKKKIDLNNAIGFSTQSTNLNWFIRFHDNEFKQLVL